MERVRLLRWVTLVAVVLAAVGLPWSRPAAASLPPTFPGASWTQVQPSDVGLSASALQSFASYMGGGEGVVVRYGYLAFSWGDPSYRNDIYSSHKVFNSFFLLKAVEAGKLASPDVKLDAFEPCVDGINASLGYKDRGITFKQMAYQISDYGVSESPGTAFDYNDWQMALFEDTLLLKVWGAGAWSNVDSQLFYPKIWNIIGAQDHPTMLAFGANTKPGRVAISPRDFARFGLLFLNKGNWNGTQVLSASDVTTLTTSPLPGTFPRTKGVAAEMCPNQRTDGSKDIPDDQTDAKGSYSWGWWTNGVDSAGNRHWPAAPLDTYAANGKWGQSMLVVIPSKSLVIAWDNSPIGNDRQVNRALKYLMAAVTQ